MFEFHLFPLLSDGEIDLRLLKLVPPDLEKKHSPSYHYEIYLHQTSTLIGSIRLRIGSDESLYFPGHIGYHIFEEYRGHHYAYKACLCIKCVALSHELETLWITCNPDNIASKKTIERLLATLVEIGPIPVTHEMYLKGETHKCIYEWKIK